MNLFFLDHDHDVSAQYHIDKHCSKMVLEAAQLIATTLWVDKLIGFVPRKLDSEELSIIKTAMKAEPPIEERQFIRYLATHHNHPSAIWTRQSLDNLEWVQVYANALNEETQCRGNKAHASCAEINKWPSTSRLPSVGLTPFALAMPDELKLPDPIEAYRLFYMLDKGPIASWKARSKPYWWDENIALTETRYTLLPPQEREKVKQSLRERNIIV